jgi:hypothetical protein
MLRLLQVLEQSPLRLLLQSALQLLLPTLHVQPTLAKEAGRGAPHNQCGLARTGRVCEHFGDIGNICDI